MVFKVYRRATVKADGAQILAVCWKCLNNSFGLGISINSKLTLRNRGIARLKINSYELKYYFFGCFLNVKFTVVVEPEKKFKGRK